MSNSENVLLTTGVQQSPMVTSIKRAKGRNAFSLLALFLSVALISMLILKAAPAPFFWLGMLWATGLCVAMGFVQGSWPRAILLNVAVIVCLAAGIEAFCVLHEYTPATFIVPLFVHDDILGWAPIRSHQARAIKPGPAGLLHGPWGSLFDVTYSIDSNGLRVAPPWHKENLARTVLFFGCSFTFGDGLRDNETLPYQVGELSGGHYRTFNFGFPAYNPAHMLTQLEQGVVRRVVDTTPQYAFYVAIPTHVARVAGRVAWGNHAPKYALDADGKLYRDGFYEDRPDLPMRLGLAPNSPLRGQLNKSALIRVISKRDIAVTDDDIRLYFSVVSRAQELLKAQYPNIQFRVILHPALAGEPDRPIYEKLRDGFRQRNIPVDVVEDILPGYKINRSQYILDARDAHPSALSNHLVAQHVLSNDLLAQQK